MLEFARNTSQNIPYKEDKSIIPVIDANDKLMLDYLAKLNKIMNSDTMNVDELKNAVDALNVFNTHSRKNYLDFLLHPERSKGCKIPSSIPVPSTSFQLHNTITLTTNSKGNVAFAFNPFFLANADSRFITNIQGMGDINADFFSTLWVNNDESLTGTEPNDHFTAVNIGQTIPSVYGSYRVVSAGLIVKYIGRMDITSGVIGGSIIFDDNSGIGIHSDFVQHPENNRYSRNPFLSKYGNFDLAMDSFYHQENLAIEGVREIYFPLDPSFEDYIKLFQGSMLNIDNSNMEDWTYFANRDFYKSGFNFFVYVLGAPISSPCFKIDVYINFECLPDARFLNYMPAGIPETPIPSTTKSTFVKIVQEKPISKSNEENGIVVSKDGDSIWSKIKKAVGPVMTGINKLAQSGFLTDVIPGFKTIASVGNMLLSDNMNIEKNE